MAGSEQAGGVKSDENALIHYGVKGMKWGRRKAEAKPASEDVKKVDAHRKTIKTGGTRALSNKELKEVVDRMNLEQQYSQLKSKNHSTINRGHDHVKKTLAFGETATKAYNIATSPAATALRKALVGV